MSRYVPTYDLGDLVIDLGAELQMRVHSLAPNSWYGFDVTTFEGRTLRVALDDTDLLVYAFDERMILLGQARFSGRMLTPELVGAAVDQYLDMLAEVESL